MPPTLLKASRFRVFSSGLARTMYGAWLVQCMGPGSYNVWHSPRTMYGALPHTLYGQSQVNYLLFQILEVAARAKSRIQCMAVQLYKKLAFYTYFWPLAIHMYGPLPGTTQNDPLCRMVF